MYGEEVYLIQVKLNLGVRNFRGCSPSWNLQETVVLSFPPIRVPHVNLGEENTKKNLSQIGQES